MKALSNANIEVLHQLKTLIGSSEAIYAQPVSGQKSPIGRHVRHVLDHYRAAKTGLENDCIDYNQRARDNLEERDIQQALRTTDQFIQWLQAGNLSDRRIEIISEINVQCRHSERLESNVARELLYLINHSIHHMAYAALLARSQGIDLPENIGLAPGTASYERDLAENHHDSDN